MNNLFLYADRNSLEILQQGGDKIVLVGGDLGYGNFGDVLQNLNTQRLVKGRGRFLVVCVFAIDVISTPRFVEWARQYYLTDAIIFVSDVPRSFGEVNPGLEFVKSIQNVAGVLLYGGGFLNTMWGEYVLGVVEYFLERCRNANYWVSGQQVTAPFERRVAEHICKYKPRLFGVRDRISLNALESIGYPAQFSFDDATESLQDLGQHVLRVAQQGLLLHLNLSDYSSGDQVDAVKSELVALRKQLASSEEVTVLQAFRDLRENVFDTREAIKRLELDFPFYDYRFIELVALLYGNEQDVLAKPISGSMGYSCSYHVALWLQLSGIPCYLRSSNPFYDQKMKALGIVQSYSEFLNEPRLSDHRENLERRAEWRYRLLNELDATPTVRMDSNLEPADTEAKSWPFHFKGTPTLVEKIEWWTGEGGRLQAEVDRVTSDLLKIGETVSDLRDALDRVTSDSLERGKTIDDLRDALDRVTADSLEKGKAIDDLVDALNGSEGRNLRLEESIRLMFESRSWRYTEPMRRVARYIRRIWRGEG